MGYTIGKDDVVKHHLLEIILWPNEDGKKKKQEVSEKLKRLKKGKKHTEEAKQKMREAHKGRIPWNKGLSKETDERVLKYTESRIKNKEVKAV